MLDALYRGNYQDHECSGDATGPLTCHVRIFMLGDKYGITAVRDLSYQKYAKELLEAEDLDEADLRQSISAIYLDTSRQDRRLQDEITEFVSTTDIHNWLSEDKSDLFVKLLRDTPALSIDIAVYKFLHKKVQH